MLIKILHIYIAFFSECRNLLMKRQILHILGVQSIFLNNKNLVRKRIALQVNLLLSMDISGLYSRRN